MATIIEVEPLSLIEAKLAGNLASHELRGVIALAKAYPASYDSERLMTEADEILDRALAEAKRIRSKFVPEPVAWSVLDDQGEFAPRIR